MPRTFKCAPYNYENNSSQEHIFTLTLYVVNLTFESIVKITARIKQQYIKAGFVRLGNGVDFARARESSWKSTIFHTAATLPTLGQEYQYLLVQQDNLNGN